MKDQYQSFNLALSKFAGMLSETIEDKDQKEQLKKASQKHFDNYKKENIKTEPIN